MRAYNLITVDDLDEVGIDSDTITEQTTQATSPDGTVLIRAGWTGDRGPAITPASWPRGPLTGLPMFHAITIRLPEEYQRRGPEFPAIAFFQGEGQFAEELDEGPDASSDDPFLVDLAAAVEHPQLNRYQDVIDGQFALLWLTEEEFAGGPSAPPADPRRPDEHGDDDEGPNAWDESGHPTAPVFLVERDDPNAGKAPVEHTDGADYTDPYDRASRDYHPWVEALENFENHLGGTAFPVQGVPEGLTPYYLELAELPGMNLGGDGNCQLDLESGVFDWACG